VGMEEPLSTGSLELRNQPKSDLTLCAEGESQSERSHAALLR